MSGFLLDTNVLSEVVRKKPHPHVLRKLRTTPGSELATSAVCAMELRFGAARHPKGEELWARLAREVLAHVRVLPLGEAESLRAGDLLAQLEAAGESPGIEDVLIASTALEAGMTVVTRNLRHFQRIPGLRVESWWL